MPANLTPQYLAAEEQYRKARTPEEQLAALKEMLRLIPKHKGTDKLQADIKRKIAETRKALSEGKKHGKKRKGPVFQIEKGKFPQVIAIGPPNAGRSQLLSVLSNVRLKVDAYPFTTRLPQPVMMPYEETKIQLIDTPPITATFMEPWLSGLIRKADAALLVADLAAGDVLEGLEAVIQTLDKQKLHLCTSGYWEEALPTAMHKRALLVANKCDHPDSADTLEILQEVYQARFQIIAVSATDGQSLEELRQAIFQLLQLIRVYPKPPGKKPDYHDPILLPRGSTVIDFANTIHHSLGKNLKWARIWDCQDYPPGARIPKDYVLHDKNVVELEY